MKKILISLLIVIISLFAVRTFVLAPRYSSEFQQNYKSSRYSEKEIQKFHLLGVDLNQEWILHHYIKNGNSSIVKKLIDLGVDASITDSAGNNGLHQLSLFSHYANRDRKDSVNAIFTLLMEKGCSPTAQNKLKDTPFDLAVARGNTVLTGLLLKTEHYSITDTLPSSNSTPLGVAIDSEQMDMIVFLLKNGAVVSEEQKQTALIGKFCKDHYASPVSKLEVLLQAGFNPNVEDSSHKAPLYYCYIKGTFKEMQDHITLLKKYGATTLYAGLGLSEYLLLSEPKQPFDKWELKNFRNEQQWARETSLKLKKERENR